MKQKQLQLEVGKTYRNRKGEVVKIVRTNESIWPFVGDNEDSYDEQGRFYSAKWESPYDLIEEVTDPILIFFTPSRMELLSISAIESAAGIPPRTLYKFLKGTRGLPKKHREPLIEILKKVGYDG